MMMEKPRLLLLDNYDSFTYNLYDYLAQLGLPCTVLRNDQTTVEAIEAGKYAGIVLSPGPNRPSDAGILMDVLRRFYDQLPMLGICLGMQAMGELFGAKLVKASVPMHGKLSPIRHNGLGLFHGLAQDTPVMRYHSLILEQLPDVLEPTAWTAEGECMALRHRHHALVGVQFHPESILTKDGQTMLQNWVQDAILDLSKNY